VIEEWERAVEVDGGNGSSEEGDGLQGEEEVNEMEEEDEALCWVYAHPIQESKVEE
jgi:hypothetical protein